MENLSYLNDSKNLTNGRIQIQNAANTIRKNVEGGGKMEGCKIDPNAANIKGKTRNQK